jgi:hypothetical protein
MESKNVRTLPKWQGTDGFRISVDELRKAFIWKKNTTDALLNERVQVAKRELKEIVRPRQCDVYFEFTEEKGRTVEMLRFKLFRNTMNVKLQTIYSWN